MILMSKATFLAAFLFGGLGQVTVPAPDAAFSFQGATLGMTLQDFRILKGGESVLLDSLERNQKGKFKTVKRRFPKPICSDHLEMNMVDAGPGEVVCDVSYGEKYRDDLVVAGLPVEYIHFFFFHGRLARIEGAFPSISYQTIAAAFGTKYGEASSVKSATYQNAGGAHWTAETRVWRRGNSSVLVAEGKGNGPGENSFEPNAAFSIRDFDVEPLNADKPKVDF